VSRARRGFTLIEVMIALAILVTSLGILFETQGVAALMSQESERMLVATQLAQEKLAQVQFQVENEGFQQDDVYEEGDFEDFGDEALDLELEGLGDYHYEFLVTQIDLSAAGDLSATMSQAMGQLPGAASNPALAGGSLPPLPISTDQITEMLDPFLREVKVRVWWGEDRDEAEEQGNEVVITTHMIQPHGNMLGALGGMGGGAPSGTGGTSGARPGQAGGGAARPGARPPGVPPRMFPSPSGAVR
jgi:prepilin-type N-terminal cleavage/methylation domain-containing protein